MSRLKNRSRARRTFGQFEELESRLPLAGNVTYSTSGGIATLTGDGLNNNIRLEPAANFANFYQLSGLNDAATNQPTTINGSNNPIFIPVADAESMTINLGDGNDQVLVKGMVMDNLTINGGLGNDRIDIGDYVPLTTPNPANNNQIILNTLTISPGSGADVVRLNYIYGPTSILVSKTASSGPDIGSLDLAVYVAFTDTLTVQNEDNAIATPNPGISNDSISLGYVTTALALFVETGDGNDLISYFACRDGVGNDGLRPRFNSGSGDDYVALDVNIYERNVFVDAGSGNDTIQFSRAVFVGNTNQTVTLFCGIGNDTLLVGKYYGLVGGQPVLLDSGSAINLLTADLGPGDDTASIVTNIFNRLEVTMGGGNDNAYFGSNLVNSGGVVRIDGDFNTQLNTRVSGTDRVRRFNNTWDAFTIDFEQSFIEETVFGLQ
jgi:hypothetical protein